MTTSMRGRSRFGLRFSDGRIIGTFDLPNPNENPFEFNEMSKEIGFHIAYGIVRGAESVEFIDTESPLDTFLRDRESRKDGEGL